jgi:hypothetical protein
MRLRLALVGVAALAAPFVFAAPAHAACATTTKTLSGTLGGTDGRYVNALIGFDIVDYAGNHIDGRAGSKNYGCGGFHGYGTFIRFNDTTPPDGSYSVGTKQWKVTLPGNTKYVHIEVYPMSPNYGGVNETRYGHAYRRKVPVPYGTVANIRLPLVCAAGGNLGGISGWVTKNGVKTTANIVGAWSLSPDSNSFQPILGWNTGRSSSTGYYVIPNLMSGQSYTVIVEKDGVTKQPYNVKVNACKNTYLPVAF